jgi:hypothetical protein
MLERRKALDVPPDSRRVRDRIAFRRRTDDLNAVLPRFNRWWDTLCRQRGLEPRAQVPNDFGYHVVELVKNGLMAGDRVFVGATVSRRELAALVQDDGPGFGDAIQDRNLSLGQGYGLQGAIEFADEIQIESRGRLYWKTPLGMQAKTREPRPGTRILLRKFLRAARGGH